ncbi:MAG: DEAD/DEAH box helicase [Gammaproteobacteria bacterium]|nr:DEAD/DEAH box helicase [Gammaproteobacteria bacterium]
MEHTPFHPAVARWFARSLGGPTPVQALAWPAAAAGRHTLIAAPTGSGKTLAAFMSAIDALVREGLERGLPDETRVLYVSPLKALSNDIQKNLEQPLAGIRDALLESGLPDVPVRAWVRTGDTPAGERERMRRTPPHILVTTPESLFILLTSESGRAMLSTVRTVIVDEIHALAGNKRGAHLALSLERLAALCGRPPVRIGLSATQKPIERMAEFLTGGPAGDCAIVDTGHVRRRDLALELPGSPLEAVMAAEVWTEIYDRLAELARAHRTTLIFVNTRRLAERAARHLAERLGEDAVTAHHGSLAREHRLDAEQRLKSGRLRALVATASLELGIDIGEVDLVCQLGSPRAIATLLQRVGRSGHAVGGLPKGRLFPLSRDDLAECAALLDAVRREELDHIPIPQAPLDVLAQQIVAEVAGREWEEEALYETLRHARPYHALTRADFTAVVRMLAEGYTTRRGRRGAYLHRDAVNGRLRARPGARLTAVTNAGAIPDQFDYDVILQPQGQFIGTLNEDFAFESLPGDIFQLGSASYRMLKIEQGKVHAEDARGQPPNIPFWFGEAPGRTDELSHAVSRLRETLEEKLGDGPGAARAWLTATPGLAPAAAEQLVDYLAAAHAAFGALPTQRQVILERFFDEAGDMHLVIHAPFGSRINRAWGLALRKRFCRKFNFELQAAATEDSIVLSLGPTHSFPLEEVAGYLRAHNVRDVLVQALLAAPMFGTRWRWVANTALAVPRNRNGRRVPAPFQRADAEDLVALVFPDQLACLENIAGDREVPEHPLVTQTLNDCLHELMDIDGLERVLAGIECGDIHVLARDLAAPSPLAAEILTARPYAFLDDAPAEERRTLAVQQRRYIDPADAAELGRLDPAAIARVRAEAWPEAATPDELHDGLVLLGFLREEEAARERHWPALLERLIEERRATRATGPDGAVRWVAAERLAERLALHPDTMLAPCIAPVIEGDQAAPEREQALLSLLRSRLEGGGPVTAATLARDFGLPQAGILAALAALEQQGFVLQGRFSTDVTETEWCERRLLARIHRYTLKQLRSEIEPVAPADFMRFLFHWQRLDDPGEGIDALAAALTQLEGQAAPAAAWEAHILPARVKDYAPDALDRLCASGRFAWFRPPATRPAPKEGKTGATSLRNTPIALVRRSNLSAWRGPAPVEGCTAELSAYARAVAEVFARHPAAFFEDLQQHSGLLHTQLEIALAELAAAGLINCDSFAGLRALLAPQHLRPGYNSGRRRRRGHAAGVEHAGRWVWLPPGPARPAADATEQIARALLRRYGVVFRRLLAREAGAPPWRALIQIYRRLEARGEIRGGRFVDGFSGEQYALPEAVGTLREIRRRPGDGKPISLSGADPLNLTGIVTPGERIPAQTGKRVVYRDGVPVASAVGGKVAYPEKGSDPFSPASRVSSLTPARKGV